MKYADTAVVFQEVPGEVTLAISLTGCPCRCPGCHSRYLWEDSGRPLTAETVAYMAEAYKGSITCVCFMGGDAAPREVSLLARHLRQTHPECSLAWYSGRARIPAECDVNAFDYIKTGPYLAHLGGLDKPTTNQRLYRVSGGVLADITHVFWGK